MSNNDKNEPKKVKFNVFWIYGAISIILLFFVLNNSSTTENEVSFSKFKEYVPQNDIKEIVIVPNMRLAHVYLTEDALKKEEYKEFTKKKGISFIGKIPDFSVQYLDLQNFENYLGEQKQRNNLDFTLDVKQQDNTFSDLLMGLLPFVLIIGLWLFFMKRMSGGSGGGPGGQIFNIGKSKAKLFDQKADIKTTFKDVAGLEGSKEEVEEIVDFLKQPEKYTS